MMIPGLAPALVTSDGGAYFRLFNLEMEIALTFAAWLAVRTADRLRPGAGTEALAYAILLTLALGSIAVRRYDPWVALAIAATVHEIARGRPALAGASLGIAVALKGVPILLAPIFASYALARGDASALARGVAGCSLTFGLSALVYAAIAGPHIWDALAYHAARPLEIQTVYSGFLILGAQLRPGFPVDQLQLRFGQRRVARRAGVAGALDPPRDRRLAGELVLRLPPHRRGSRRR